SVKITGYNNTYKEGTLYLFSGDDIVETLYGNFTKEEINAIIESRNNPKPVVEEAKTSELFSPEPTVEESKEELATFNGTANQDPPVTREEMQEMTNSESDKSFQERVEEKIDKAFDSDCSKYQEEIATLKKENEDLELKFQAVSDSKDL